RTRLLEGGRAARSDRTSPAQRRPGAAGGCRVSGRWRGGGGGGAVLGRHIAFTAGGGRARLRRHRPFSGGALPTRPGPPAGWPAPGRAWAGGRSAGRGVRDRGAAASDPERIRFSSALLPPYARRTKSLDVLLPILYLRGLSTGDFQEALTALLGKNAPGLS